MDLRHCLFNFNANRFFIAFMLLFFSILLSLRFDNLISWSFWVVFLPIWLWKFVVVAGFLVGSVVWCRHPHYRADGHVSFRTMVFSTSSQVGLGLFEILLCAKLENGHNDWIFVFLPLLLLSLFSIAVCTWAIKNNQTFELELFLSVNILFFIFLPLKLDNWIKWNWSVVFIPVWIIMGVTIVLEIYGIMLAVILCRSPDLLPDQRQHTFATTLGYACVIFPLLAFQILLVQKLDGEIDSSYSIIIFPLILSFVVLIAMSFVVRSDNTWWFGARRPLCQLLIEICHPLQEYGNISYNLKPIGGRLHYRIPSYRTGGNQTPQDSSAAMELANGQVEVQSSSSNHLQPHNVETGEVATSSELTMQGVENGTVETVVVYQPPQLRKLGRPLSSLFCNVPWSHRHSPASEAESGTGLLAKQLPISRCPQSFGKPHTFLIHCPD